LNDSRSNFERSIYFKKDDVIRAETLVARGEFDPFVGLEQAIGWSAYRNLQNFRSLGKLDLRGKRYYGASYGLDYETVLPEKELFEAIVEWRIKGLRKVASRWEELTLTNRIEARSIWDFSDVIFARKSLIEVWPPRSSESISSVLPSGEQGGTLNDENKISRVRIAKKKTGPKGSLKKTYIARMLADIDSGKESCQSLHDMSWKELLRKYDEFGAGKRTTVVEASKAVLAAAGFVPTDSNK
jgi:hypothetical protein